METDEKTEEQTVKDESTDVQTEKRMSEFATEKVASGIEKLKKTIIALKGARTRDRNRFRTALADRARIDAAIKKVAPETLLIKRGDIFRIFTEYGRLVREELHI